MLSRLTSTLSDVKFRRDVVINRTRRSKTISSIGRRSYETSAELMIARMPVRSSEPSPDKSKPSRLSISSWFRMRSEPPSPPPSSQPAMPPEKSPNSLTPSPPPPSAPHWA